MAPGLGGVTHRLADLEAVLVRWCPRSSGSSDAQFEQRRVVVAGDLERA